MQRKVQLDTMEASVIDNNEADAYLVAKFSGRFKHLQSGTLNPQDLTPSEVSVFIQRTRRVKTMVGVVHKRVAHSFRENSRFFQFSAIPEGSISLPTKSAISPAIIEYLNQLEDAN